MEKEIFKGFVNLLSPTFGSETENIVIKMLNTSIEKSKTAGTYILPTNFGDVVVEEAYTDNPRVVSAAAFVRKRIFDYKELENISTNDIKEFWNMTDVERRMSEELDNILKSTLIVEELKKGKTMDEATEQVFKWHPIYGDPRDESKRTGENKPLPYELRARINIYIEQVAKQKPNKYRNEIESFSSFNAFVRKKIKNREI